MQIVERQNIDIEKWNALVEHSTSKFFSYSWYLDAVAENWEILVDQNYSCGMALPYSKRLGVDTLYTPIFCRYMEWLGNSVDHGRIELILSSRFKSIEFSVRQKLFDWHHDVFVYQEVKDSDERKLGSQAKRMLKKAEKTGIECTRSDNFENVLDVIEKELKNSIKGIDDSSFQSLRRLFIAGHENGVLKVYSTENGGVVCFENEKECMYLKGTVEEAEKRNGGMYLLINEAIEEREVSSRRG